MCRLYSHNLRKGKHHESAHSTQPDRYSIGLLIYSAFTRKAFNYLNGVGTKINTKMMKVMIAINLRGGSSGVMSSSGGA
jgi:hypothetical protein